MVAGRFFMASESFKVQWYDLNAPKGNLGPGLRIRRFFAIFPVTDGVNYRWFGMVHVKEHWRFRGYDGDGGYWTIHEFINEPCFK